MTLSGQRNGHNFSIIFLVTLMMVLITLLWEISILYYPVNSNKLVRITAIAARAKRITRLDECCTLSDLLAFSASYSSKIHKSDW